METVLRPVVDDADLRACFPVMRVLRDGLISETDFIARVRRQTAGGYRMLAVWQDAEPVALAGYRLQENLLHGLHLFVDDLVASVSRQRNGLGAMLLDALQDEGRATGCGKLVLGTGLANALAQRFYYRQGMLATGLSFSLTL